MRRRQIIGLTGCAVGALTGVGTSGPAAAQDQGLSAVSAAPTERADGSEIVVTGEAFATERAIAAKRDRPIVSDTISASEIGAIPEFGLGEALQRVPGVSFVINNGRGEAQFMTLRGLNPDYNSLTIDGIQLPSTEETRRQVSFDVLPSIIANQVSVYKSYTADQPSDAVGGVTNLTSHSAFDHVGPFIAGHFDYAYWERKRRFHGDPPSGQGDVRASTTFGSDNQFGVVVLGSYYLRYSNSLNSYSLPYSYYNYTGGAQTVNATPLTPTTNVSGLTAIPDRRRWYLYDNRRQRPGGFAKLEFDDKADWRASVSGGFFEHYNDEFRYSQYLNRGAATATFTAADQASFATGTAETDFDKYNQHRRLWYIQANGGYALDEATRIDVVANYARGFYRQDTIEDVFTSATSATFAPQFVGNVQGIPLFTPVNATAFQSPASYVQTYHLTARDQGVTKVPQVRIDLTHQDPASDQGLSYSAGFLHRRTQQDFFYNERRLNPVAGSVVTAAQTGPLAGSLIPHNANGLQLNFLDPDAVSSYIYSHGSQYAPAASDVQRSILNNFSLKETVDGGYGQAAYRAGQFYVQAGVRYEHTSDDILNYQPSPLTSTTNFIGVRTKSDYNKFLPEANVTFDVTETFKIRGAVSRTLARPRFSDLAQNQSLTLSGTTATQTIANPNLKPRTSTNYDLSAEFYPRRSTALSVAVFQKDLKDEIFSLTTTVQNTTLPGYSGSNYTLITTTPVNAGNARIRGVEFGASVARFDFLPGLLANLGATANLTLIDFRAPSIQMADSVTYRRLPQLLESTKIIANVALFYRVGRFSGEVAYNHTGKMPTSFDRTNAVNDQWYRATDTADAQISYRAFKGVEVRAQVKNLTNQNNQRLVGPNQSLNYSLLENGRAYYLGVGFAF